MILKIKGNAFTVQTDTNSDPYIPVIFSPLATLASMIANKIMFTHVQMGVCCNMYVVDFYPMFNIHVLPR